MQKALDLVGKWFGKLKVLTKVSNRFGKSSFTCVCDCGKLTNVIGSSLVKEDGTKSCGCIQKNYFIDLTGETFGNFKILKLIGKNKSNCWTYLVKCICGKQIIQEGNDVKSGKIKSCGCQKSVKSINKANQDPASPLIREIYNGYKNKAERRNLYFNLTFEEFKSLILQKCYYCDISSSNIKKPRKDRKALKVHINYNGIDRINNELGYSLDNVRTCCRICNQAKHQMTQEFFYDWVKRISKNLLERDELDRLRQEIVDAKAAEKSEGWDI